MLSFKPEISNLVANKRYVNHDKIRNFSSISPKLCANNRLGVRRNF